MSFLPDIEDGQIKEESAQTLYTPPRRVRSPDFDADFEKRDPTYIKGQPTMANIHTCAPNQSMECITCGREMLI